MWTLTPILQTISLAIWGIFIICFLLKFSLAPRKLRFLKTNCLTALSLLIPAQVKPLSYQRHSCLYGPVNGSSYGGGDDDVMGKMYPDKRINTGIIIGSIVLFAVILAALRTQTPIGDVQYMKAMIPHHSSAIMVSKHADIKDPEVKKLSEQIIQSQEKEIAEMEAMLNRLEK